jgi:DNA-binding winged helix-turn-helix (wHTH) protein
MPNGSKVLSEFLTKNEAVMSASMSRETKLLYEFGVFCLDPDELLLFKEQRVVRVAPRAVEILVVLAEHRDRVVEKQELLNRVWGRPEANPDGVKEGNIAQHIHDLRNVLGDTRQASRFIVNVHGRGYQFVAQVTERIVEKQGLGRARAPIVDQTDEVAPR